MTELAPIACRLTGPEQTRRRRELERELLVAVQEVEEVEDGYGLRFPVGDEWIEKLGEFIRFERACCPFLRFEIHVGAEDGPLWLRLRGRPGVKEFIGETFIRSRVEGS